MKSGGFFGNKISNLQIMVLIVKSNGEVREYE